MRDDDHIPVLLEPVLRVLAPNQLRGRPLTYLDCTAGLGGHAAAIAKRLPSGSTVILNDLDSANLEHATARLKGAAPGVTVLTHKGNFAAAPRWVTGQGLAVDLLLADLGFASPQVDNPARGLSFLHDGPLDMRFNPESGSTAADLIASLPEADLAQIFFEWGEERNSRPIARAIVEARKIGAITSTGRLGEVVRAALRGKVPPREVTGIDPATKTFQALRIAVNDELGNLHALLDQVEKGAKAGGWLATGAVAAVITFHSLEDRPVKQAFARLVESGKASEATPKGKPIAADEEEVRANPRARSAKLRAVRLSSAVHPA